MSNSSVLYSIGTALNRAHDHDAPVQILVEGVIGMESISAVPIFSPAPQQRTPVTAGAHEMPAAASF